MILLLRAGADPMVADINGNTPLHFFAIAAAEFSPKNASDKKDDKEKVKEATAKLKAMQKRHTNLVELLGCNRKCRNR